MKQLIRLLTASLLLMFMNNALSAQTASHGRLTINLPDDWKLDTTEHTCLRLNARNRTAMLRVYDFGTLSLDEATAKTIELMQARGLEPATILAVTPEHIKIAKRDHIYIGHIEVTYLESTNMNLYQWWGAYLTEINGSRVFVYASEFYKDVETTDIKAKVESLIESLRLSQ